MARAFLARAPALGAAALCALSPLALEYAQQVRVYVFAMLAVALAVGATVRAVQQPRDRRRLLWIGAITAILALWLHYTALFIVAPLCVWLAAQASVSRRARLVFIGACAVAELIALPLFFVQYDNAPNGGLVGLAGVTATNVLDVVGTPFDGRFTSGADAIRILAAAVVVGSVTALALTGRGAVRERRLLVALSLLAPVVILVAGLVGKDVVITRYTAVAVPFLVTAIAAAAATCPRALGAALISGAVVAGVVGVIESHRTTSFYAPARETIDYIQAHQIPSNVVVSPGDVTADLPIAYYAEQRLRPIPRQIPAVNRRALLAAMHQRRMIWILAELSPRNLGDSQLLRSVAFGLRPLGYRPLRVRRFTTSTSLAVILAAPAGAGPTPPAKRP